MLLRTTLAAAIVLIVASHPARADELTELKETVRILQQQVRDLQEQVSALEPLRLAYQRQQDYLDEVETLGGTPGPIASTGKIVAADAILTAGQVLQVEWNGEWWAAKVVETPEALEVRVHYLGWGATWDEVVERSRLQLDPHALEKAQASVAAIHQRQQDFVNDVDDVGGTPGPIESTGEAVIAETELLPGQTLQVEWNGNWWAATVLEALEGGKVRIHYLGWGASWDEVVERDRLQLDPDALEKARGTIAHPAAQPPESEPGVAGAKVPPIE